MATTTPVAQGREFLRIVKPATRDVFRQILESGGRIVQANGRHSFHLIYPDGTRHPAPLSSGSYRNVANLKSEARRHGCVIDGRPTVVAEVAKATPPRRIEWRDAHAYLRSLGKDEVTVHDLAQSPLMAGHTGKTSATKVANGLFGTLARHGGLEPLARFRKVGKGGPARFFRLIDEPEIRPRITQPKVYGEATWRQRILDYVRKINDTENRRVSTTEISRAIGYSKSSTSSQLAQLHQQGLLARHVITGGPEKGFFYYYPEWEWKTHQQAKTEALLAKTASTPTAPARPPVESLAVEIPEPAAPAPRQGMSKVWKHVANALLELSLAVEAYSEVP